MYSKRGTSSSANGASGPRPRNRCTCNTFEDDDEDENDAQQGLSFVNAGLNKAPSERYGRTAMPFPFKYAFSSGTVISPKWNTLAASSTSACPSAAAW